MKRAGYAAFLLGIGLLAFLALRANWPVLLHALASLGPSGLLVLVALHLPVIAAAGLAWWYFGRKLPHASLSGFVRARHVRDSVGAALPFSQIGGFAAGIRVLALSRVPAVGSGLSMFADLVAEFASLFPYIAIGLVVLATLAPSSGLLRPFAIGTAVTMVAMIVAGLEHRRVARRLRAHAGKLISRFAGSNFASGIGRSPGAISLSPRAVAANVSLHFGRWAIGAFETWVAFRLMGVPVSPGQALVVDCMASALRIFAFMVPAAIGVQEGVYVLVCGTVGLSPAIALAFSFIWRARDLVIGFLGLALWHAEEARAATGRIGGDRDGLLASTITGRR